MAFPKKKKTTKKEFIEYKDGKLVSTPVESKKPKSIEKKESIPDYQEMPQSVKKEKKKIDFRPYLSWQRMKLVVGVLFLIFFAWAIYDLYQSFSDTSKTEYIPEEQTKPNSPASVKENVSVALPQTDTDEKDEQKVEEQSGRDELSYALRRASEVNDVVVGTSTEEIDYLQDYLERQANRMGLEDHLDRQLAEKEKAHYQFLEDKSFYETSSLATLYDTTEKRLRLSIEFSKGTKSLLVGGANRSEIANFLDQYVKEDGEIKKEQTNRLLHALTVNNVSFEHNEETETLTYSIQ